MKKLLLTLIIGIFSFNGYAFEQVIGISGGLSQSKSKVNHWQKTEFDNPNFNPSCPESPNNLRRIQNNWKDGATHKNNGYNINLEYQVRLDFPTVMDNFFVLGVGYTYEDVSIKPNYQDLSNFKSTMHNPYILAMITLFSGKSAGISKDINVRWGWAFGQGFNKADSYKYKKLTADMILDAEYGISDNILIFSRANFAMVDGKDNQYNTNLSVNKDPIYEQNQVILDNYIKTNSKDSTYRINFGIRYKI